MRWRRPKPSTASQHLTRGLDAMAKATEIQGDRITDVRQWAAELDVRVQALEAKVKALEAER